MDEPTSPKRAADDLDQSTANASFKRRRTALACNSCRTRKTRCNGERPSCVPCIELGLECIYETPVNSNGRFSQTTYDDRLKSIEDTLRLLVHSRQPSLQIESGYEHPALSKEANGVHAVQTGERSVRLQDEAIDIDVDQEEDGMASIKDLNDSDIRFYGPSSNIAFLRHLSEATHATIKTAESGLPAQQQHPAQPLVSRVPSPINTPSTTVGVDKDRLNPLALPSEAQTNRLLELYFNDTGILFPFIHKGHVVSTYNSIKSRGMTGVRKTFLCLLHSILAMAAHIDEDRTTSPTDAETFYQRAHQLQSQIDFKLTNIEIVQSLLIMIQYRQGTQKSDDTWVLLGRAVRIAMQLGLHSTCDRLNSNAVEVEVKKRTWYNCVILDRVLSMTFGRPQTISKEYIRLDLPVNRDLDSLSEFSHQTPFQRDGYQPQTVCFFIATIQLYDILDFVLATIYDHNLCAESEISLPEVLKHGITIEQKLRTWQDNLPPELMRRPWCDEGQQILLDSPIFDKLSAIIHLRFLNISLLHHRAILDRFLDSLHPENQQLPVSRLQDPFFLNFAKHSLQVSEESAMEIVDIVWKMSHRTSALGAWWFSAYYTFNASLVMYGCILVLFSLSKKDKSQSTMISHPDRQQRIERMINYLSIAVKAIERVGKGTRTAKGIRRTLIKIIQISTGLSQLHADMGLLTEHANGVLHAKNTPLDDVPNGLLPNGSTVMDASQHQSYQTQAQLMDQWGNQNFEYWTSQTGYDIFQDLGSLDLGLGSFMAA